MANMTVKWNRISGFISDPPGFAIVATPEHATVELAGQILVEMRVHKPEAVLLGERAIVVQLTQRGMEGGECSMSQAEEWAKGMQINHRNMPIKIGEQLLEAWQQHIALRRAAHQEASPLVTHLDAPKPIILPGGRGRA